MKELQEVNNAVYKGKNAFILVFMEGCGPCNETLPEWTRIQTVLGKKYLNDDSVIVAAINKDFLSSIPYIGSIEGFPTMKHVSKKGKHLETFEGSRFGKGSRNTSSFVSWIESKMDKMISNHPVKPSKYNNDENNKTKKHQNMKGGSSKKRQMRRKNGTRRRRAK
jgi:thiol-disulfide isomerase/thioredoxin